MKNATSKNLKSRYNPNRPCYLSSDGKAYCYEVWDSDAKQVVIQRIEIGKDGITEEWLRRLDELDHENDLNDRYQDELRSPLCELTETSDDSSLSHAQSEKTANPWDRCMDTSNSPEIILFREDEPENPDIEKIRRIIEESCTESQKSFYYEHFGMMIQLEEIRQTEAEKTGKLPSSAAMTNRKNKIIDKVAKSFGVERVKRHKYPKKDCE